MSLRKRSGGSQSARELVDRLTLLDPAKSVSSSAIDSAARKHGFRIPVELRELLLRTNGGIPTLGFYADKIWDHIRVARFLPVTFARRDGSTIESTISRHKSSWLPDQQVPFAEDDGGNLFCFHRADGIVSFLDHEGDTPTRLCASMRDFFLGLTDIDSEGDRIVAKVPSASALAPTKRKAKPRAR